MDPSSLVSFYELLTENYRLSSVLTINLIILFLVVVNWANLRKVSQKFRNRYDLIILLIIIHFSVTLVITLPKELHQIVPLILISFSALFFLRNWLVTIPTMLWIRCAKNILAKGEYFEFKYESLFSKNPFFALTFYDRYKCSTIRSYYYCDRQEFHKAYLCISNINESTLFEKEKFDHLLNKANILIALGSLEKANIVLESASNVTKNYNISYFNFLKSQIEESRGNIDLANELIDKALSSIDEQDIKCKIQILNNFGRRMKLSNHLSEAIYYYNLAFLSIESVNRQSQHAIYHNLILSLLEDPSNVNNINRSKELRKKYNEKFIDGSIYDLINLVELNIIYLRQTNSYSELEAYYRKAYDMLREKMENHSVELQCNVLASGFRLLTDSRLDLQDILGHINNKKLFFFSLDMPMKYFLLHEFFIGCKVINPISIVDYKSFFSRVKEYLKNDAKLDLEKAIDETIPEQIYDRIRYRKELIANFKEFHEPYDFNIIQKWFKEIIGLSSENNLLHVELYTSLDLVDEMLSENNKMDGEFILRNEALEYLDSIKKIIAVFDNQTISEAELRTAAYYLFLEEKTESRFFYKRFCDRGVSILNFKDWLRWYYVHLKNEFG